MFGLPQDGHPPEPQTTGFTTTTTTTTITTASNQSPLSSSQVGISMTNQPKFGLFSQGPTASFGQTDSSLTSSSFGAFRIPQTQPTSVFKTSHFGTSMFGKSVPPDSNRTPAPFSNIGGANSGTPPPDVKLVFGPQKTSTNVSATYPKWYATPEKPPPQLPPAFSFSNQGQGINPSSTPFVEKAAKKVTFSFGNAKKRVEPTGKVESNIFKSDITNPFSKPGGVFRAEMKKIFPSEATKLITSLTKTASETEKAQPVVEICVEDPKPTKTSANISSTSAIEPVKLTGVKSRLSLPLKKPNLKVATDKPTKSKPLSSPTKEEINQITSIICKEVPDKVNNKQFMNKHFSKFGKIKLLRCNPKKKDTTVHYYDHKSALAAKIKGSTLDPDDAVITIFWYAVTSKSKDSRRRRSSSEVEDELMSMAGDDFLEPKILSRPDSVGKGSPKKIGTKEQAKKKKSETTTSGPAPDESLHSILERSATEPGDRYKILDARDKLMRMKTRKQSDINKATAVVGTCPDMCPEKERYSRAENYGLSLFEQTLPGMETLTTGKMNPRAVIKEYSRSSADQEEPLSHELRPPQSLQLTMDYILCNVMDLDSNAGEWFDFIWNRTRSIRKDLTQQHLCDPVCVSLVEKCARFHIHCSAALFQEDISVFDPKINNENLTKCLQTLKHFYDDLAEKNIVCPNEAEFRAYDILLNLNEGDIIRQAQQFSEVVRKSEIISFSTEIFLAHNSNNYVRFFRLVRSAPYLVACILQRYFQHVRIKAMSAICKAYRKPNSLEQFSVTKLAELLGFESKEETETFCHWLELKTTSADGVLLQKPSIPTSGGPPPTQPIKLIHSKRKTSIGEVVNGGPLSPNPFHTYEPHDSFDLDGRLKKEAYDAQDQAVKVLKQLTSSEEVTAMPPTATPSLMRGLPLPSAFAPSPPSFIPPSRARLEDIQNPQEMPSLRTAPEEVVCNIVTDLSMEVVPALSVLVAQEVLSETKTQFANSFANQAMATIVSDIVHLMSRDVSIDILEEALNEKAKWEELQRIKRFVTEFSNSLIEEITAQECYEVAKQVTSETRNAVRETIAEEVLHSICEELIRSECSLVANTVYQSERVWADKVEAFVNEKKTERVRKLFKRWHSICVSRRTFEQVKLMFPTGPLMGFEAAKRIRLDAFSLLTIEDQAKLTKKTNQHITADLYYHLLDGELSKQPIDVLNVVKDCLLKHRKKRLILWKAGIFLPCYLKKNCLSDCIIHKFKLGFQNQDFSGNNDLLVSKPKVDVWNGSGVRLCTSVQAFRSSRNRSIKVHVPKDVLKGVSALLVIVEILKDRSNFIEDLQTCNDSLQDLLTAKPPLPPVPLAFVALVNNHPLTSGEEDNLLRSSCSYLDVLRASGQISEYNINVVHPTASSVDIHKKLEEILVWFADNVPEVSTMSSTYLQDFLEDGIKKLVLNPVFEDLSYKKKCFETDLQSPNAIVHLYNSALEFLANIACQDYFRFISWPAPEFSLLCHNLPSMNWNDPTTLETLRGKILSLQLEEVLSQNLFPFKIQEAYNWVYKFSDGLKPRMKTMFVSQFEAELRRSNVGNQFMVSWANLLTSVFSLMCTATNNGYNEKEMVVTYFEEDLQNFQFPIKWLESTTEATTERALERSLMLNKPSENLMDFESQLCSESLESQTVPLLGVEYYSSSAQHLTDCLSQNLDRSLLKARKESEEFTRRLRALARSNNTSPSSFFESSLFDSPPVLTPIRRISNLPIKRLSLPDNLDDSFSYIRHTLKQEKESAFAYNVRLKLLEK